MTLLERIWYRPNHPLSLLMAPLGWINMLLVALRRRGYREGFFHSVALPVPVIVVGNISVGGTGKTPFVIWLVHWLKRAGYKPGVVSRGYGGKATSWPQQVRIDSAPDLVGDEPVLLARHCQCPVAVGPDRVAAAHALLDHHDCDILVADDGLQHYALVRDLEIAIVDGDRRHGNGRCLPAGPLRERPARLDEVDIIVSNGRAERGEFPMTLEGRRVHRVGDVTVTRPLDSFNGRVHAVAGIGNPDRFFRQLRRLGLQVVEHPLPDHHPIEAADVTFDDGLPVLMTEKDAVKCESFADASHWVLPVVAELAPQLDIRLRNMLKGL